jgi:hypothetical protein
MAGSSVVGRQVTALLAGTTNDAHSKQRKVGNFLFPTVRLRENDSWMIAAPVVSERAVNALAKFSDSLEFLPLVEVRGKKYFALNVISVERDLLNLQRARLIMLHTVRSH